MGKIKNLAYMKKIYKLNESNEGFRIIDLEDGRKNIILADGTDVAKFMGVSGIDDIKEKTMGLSGTKIYVCSTSPKTYTYIVSNINGGKLFKCPLDDVGVCHDTIFVYSKYKKCALLDKDFNIISGGWYNDISYSQGDNIIVEFDGDMYGIFDTKAQKMISNKEYTQIIDGRDELYLCYNEDDTFDLIDYYGSYINEHPVSNIETEENTYRGDNFLSFSEYFSEEEFKFVIVTETYDEYIYIPCTEEKIKIDSCEIIDTPNDEVHALKDTNTGKINYLGHDRKLKFEEWFDEFDTETLDPSYDKSFVIIREENGKPKYNIVGTDSMQPYFKEDEWLDGIERVQNEILEFDVLIMRRGSKYSIMNVVDSRYPSLDFDWVDKIAVSEKYKMIVIMKSNNTFLYVDGYLFECDKCKIGEENRIIFIHSRERNKWNAITWGSHNLLLKEYDEFDNVFDFKNEYPVIESDGKYAFFDTYYYRIVPFKQTYNGNRPIYYDDVECYEEGRVDKNDFPIFTVYKNGKPIDVNTNGEVVEDQ